MAADPRQFTEHNEVAGGNIYYEDKRMEELKGATGKTASQISTTDEYIPLQDTDGNLVKINPASFQEAVRNVLGSLLANNDKGTTISGVPALSGSGAQLDFGSITPANLASVLGVAERGTLSKSGYTKHTCFLDAPDDFNEITAPGLYSLQNPILMSNKPPVSSNGVIGFLIVGGWDARRLIQLYVDENTIYRRYINAGGWSGWVEH